MLEIRSERPEDGPAIHAIHAAAFPTDAETRLVDLLREAGRLTLSLVAEYNESIVGHVAFSPVTLATTTGGWGLAPVAVHPRVQRRGIGAQLIGEGLLRARAAGAPFVVVLGEPSYYGRLGFQPARSWGLHDEYGGGDAFQAIELIPGGIPAGGGLVRYAPEFALVS